MITFSTVTVAGGSGGDWMGPLSQWGEEVGFSGRDLCLSGERRWVFQKGPLSQWGEEVGATVGSSLHSGIKYSKDL